MSSEPGYRGPQVCKIVGITYRQLDYWARTDLVRPSVCDAAGSGTQRLYSWRDLVDLRVIKQMLDAGLALQSARKAVESLRSFGDDLASVSIVIQGESVVLAKTDELTMDLLKHGQGVLSLMDLAPVVESIDSAVQLTLDLDTPERMTFSEPLPHDTVRFAHNSERQFAKLLDFYGIAWDYEPRTFTLEHDSDGKPAQAFTPDFYLPAYDLYIEITTLNQKLVTKKNKKARRLAELYPDVAIKVLYQRDYLQLLVKYGLEPPSQLVEAGGSPDDLPVQLDLSRRPRPATTPNTAAESA